MEHWVYLTVILFSSTVAFPWSQVQEVEAEVKAKPSFCRQYECPSYDVILEGDDYELRRYQKTVWVKTDVRMNGEYWEDRGDMSQSFMKLFRYISGANEQGQKMDMTVPVAMSHTQDKVEMAFLIPAEFADNPPEPSEDGVSINHCGVGEFYVRSFGWFGYFFGHNRYKSNLEDLMSDLEKEGKSYNKDMFFTAGYNDPWTIFNRHNEVWVPNK